MLATAAPFVLLFVDAPSASAEFYERLLDTPPVETSPTFAMFPLPGGAMLGLWSRHTAEPAVVAQPGGSELALLATDVDAVHDAWRARGIRIAQAPTDMDFGRTFVAHDPDGHRIRVFCPAP